MKPIIWSIGSSQSPPPGINHLGGWYSKLIRLFCRLASPLLGPKHTDLWPLGRLIRFFLGRSVLHGQRHDGTWLAFPLPVYTNYFIFGVDHKRYGQDNIHPLFSINACKGTVAIDVGASCGQEIVGLSKAVGPEGTVYCFEPSFSFEALKDTVALNHLTNVVCVRAGVGAKAGAMPLNNNGGLYFIGANMADQSQGQLTEIPIVSIDSFLHEMEEERPVSLIKIDTDGYELEVISGAMGTIKAHKTNIIAEFEAQFDYSGKQGLEILKAYQGLGFVVEKVQIASTALQEEEFDQYLSDIKVKEKGIAHDIVLRPGS